MISTVSGFPPAAHGVDVAEWAIVATGAVVVLLRAEIGDLDRLGVPALILNDSREGGQGRLHALVEVVLERSHEVLHVGGNVVAAELLPLLDREDGHLGHIGDVLLGQAEPLSRRSKPGFVVLHFASSFPQSTASPRSSSRKARTV